jgi:bifunctional N-acetylglucosamine-1-phosphate-uridyltransferase/glucosamine-1-phosphate-acetyltransferase GlmU-like protein
MTRYKFARIEKNINYGRPIMSLSIVILAAGEGKRMKSATSKVMHHLAGRPLLEHVIDAAIQLNPTKLVVVAGNDEGQVVPFLEYNQIETVRHRSCCNAG